MLDYDYRRALAFAFCMFIAIGCTQTLAEGQTVDPGLEAERNKTVPDTAPKAPTPDELEPLVSQTEAQMTLKPLFGKIASSTI